MQTTMHFFNLGSAKKLSSLKRLVLNLSCSLAIMMCFSFTLHAQLPVKNSVITGDWKLMSIIGEHDSYFYNCEKKDFTMGTDLLFSMGEAKADIFEKEIIKEAEKTFFKIKANGTYELALGVGSVDKGTWKSKAVDESEEGFIPDTFGYLILTSDGEEFQYIVRIEAQQAFLSMTVNTGGGLSQDYLFRKDFKGSAFK